MTPSGPGNETTRSDRQPDRRHAQTQRQDVPACEAACPASLAAFTEVGELPSARSAVSLLQPRQHVKPLIHVGKAQ